MTYTVLNITFILITLYYILVYILPIICENLPYTLYTSTKI